MSRGNPVLEPCYRTRIAEPRGVSPAKCSSSSQSASLPATKITFSQKSIGHTLEPEAKILSDCFSHYPFALKELNRRRYVDLAHDLEEKGVF